MLNLTLTALSISNLCLSPLFYIGKNKATFSYLNIYNSFSPSILAESSLYITNSKFKNFLSSAIVISKAGIEQETKKIIDQVFGSVTNTIFERCKASDSYNNNGGGVYCLNSKLVIKNSFFAFCEAKGKGGAAYADLSNSKDCLIENTRTYFCTASEGSSFYIINSKQTNITQSSIEESAPSQRSGIKSNCYISTNTDYIANVNYTSCYSQFSSATLYLDCSESQTIRFATFQHSVGYNILCLRGLCDISTSSIEKVVMMNNTLNGLDNSIGNDRYEGNSMISIMGEFRISDSFIIIDDSTQLVSIGFGTVTFFRCSFSVKTGTFDSFSNVFFSECSTSEKLIVLPSYSFKVNDIKYTGPNYYRDETPKIDQKPPKPKFILKKRLPYLISGIVLTVVFLILTILACTLLRRHRQHVLVILHETYAAEAREKSEDEEEKIDDEKDASIFDVDEKEKKKKKKENLNDFDDFYQTTKKDNRFRFDDVEVPDTNLWDTDEGDVQVPDEEAFMADVDDILEGFKPNESSKKKKKKRRNKLSAIIKKGKRKRKK